MVVEITRTEHSSSDLRKFASVCKDTKASCRMLALAMVLDGANRTTAANTCGMDCQTLRDWVHRYNNEGLEGLGNRRAQGRKRFLTDEQRSELEQIVRDGPNPEIDGVVRWRRIDLQRVIEERLGVKMHERTVGKQLTSLGFRRLSVRPQHPKSDPQAQETFKKTLLPT